MSETKATYQPWTPEVDPASGLTQDQRSVMNSDLATIKARHTALVAQWDRDYLDDTELEARIICNDMPVLFEGIKELVDTLMAVLEPAGDTPEEVREQCRMAVRKWR